MDKPTPGEVFVELEQALGKLVQAKPNDRSELDREYAVVITEMRKVIANFYFYILFRVQDAKK